jgi:hypothetical protein
MDADIVKIDLADLAEYEKVALLAGLLAHWDRDFAIEVGAVAEKWADQNDVFKSDGSINPLGKRPAADYRALAETLNRDTAKR